jgi:regulator of cell morphogenesis and NO signaling
MQGMKTDPCRGIGKHEPNDHTMDISPERTVGSIVAEDYRAAAVLDKYGIEYCCNGGRSFQQACDRLKVDRQQLADEIALALARGTKDADDAGTWPLDKLADHVETVHHRYVEERGPIIKQNLAKLCKVHGDRHPELFTVKEEFDTCLGAMAMHMKKEELLLFPFVRRLAMSERTGEPVKQPRFGSVENPVKAMMEDHSDEGARFRRMREVSNNFALPADGCSTYATTLSMLREFEEDLHLHIHLENNIMFPRAIELDKRLAHVPQ